MSCGLAQFIGGPTNPNGPVYTLEQCAIAQASAIGVCGCPGEATPAPVKAPLSPAPTDAPETVFCLICPEGTRAMGTGSIGGMQCQDVDMMGRNSELTESECLAAQTRAAQEDDPCLCMPMTAGTFCLVDYFLSICAIMMSTLCVPVVRLCVPVVRLRERISIALI